MRLERGRNKVVDFENILNYKEKIYDMYVTQGLSLNKIAMVFNTSPSTIKQKLIDFGCVIRDRKKSFDLSMQQVYDKDE